MRAGQLRYKVDLEQRSATQTGNMGSLGNTWSTVASGLYARIEPAGSTESKAGGAYVSSTTHLVTIWYRAGVVPAMMRLKYGTRLFNILAVNDPDGRRERLQLQCEEGAVKV